MKIIISGILLDEQHSFPFTEPATQSGISTSAGRSARTDAVRSSTASTVSSTVFTTPLSDSFGILHPLKLFLLPNIIVESIISYERLASGCSKTNNIGDLSNIVLWSRINQSECDNYRHGSRAERKLVG